MVEWNFPGGSAVKDLLAMQEPQETWVRSQGQEDPLEKGWQPNPVFLPGESHGQSSLAGYTVHGVAKSRTWVKQLRTHAILGDICLRKEKEIMDTWLKLDLSNWIPLLEWEGAKTHPAQPSWEQRPEGWWSGPLQISEILVGAHSTVLSCPRQLPGSLGNCSGAFWSPYQRDPKS